MPRMPLLIAVCAACLAMAVLALARLRRRLGKSRAAALTFVAPLALLAPPAAAIVQRGAWAALLPLATIALLLLVAAGLFLPTRATRFAAFERQFWAYVERRG